MIAEPKHVYICIYIVGVRRRFLETGLGPRQARLQLFPFTNTSLGEGRPNWGAPLYLLGTTYCCDVGGVSGHHEGERGTSQPLGHSYTRCRNSTPPSLQEKSLYRNDASTATRFCLSLRSWKLFLVYFNKELTLSMSRYLWKCVNLLRLNNQLVK